MRSIFVGVEYAGKSTLIDHLDAYYRNGGAGPISTITSPSRTLP